MHVSFLDWVPGLITTLGMLVVNLIDKGTLAGDGGADSRDVWRARLVLFLGFALMAGGLAGNRILERKAAAMVRREFTPGFRIDLHHKDLGIVTAAARDAGVAIPLGAQVAQLMAAARQLGHGDLDHSGLMLLVEQLSGRAKD